MSQKTGILFTIINVLAAFCLVLSLIGNFLSYQFWSLILNGIFKLALVVLLLVVEFVQTPPVVKPFSFMFYFLGRGCFYILLGFLTMGIDTLSIIGGFILALIGIFYVVMHFVKRDGEPDSMSFVRYQRLSSGISHDLPTADNIHTTYPVAHQVPLSQPNLTEPAKSSPSEVVIPMPAQPTETPVTSEKTEA